MSWLDWLLPWRAKGLIARLRLENRALVSHLQAEQREHHGTKRTLEDIKAKHDHRDRQLKQLTAFLVVTHRLPLPSEPGSIRSILQRRS